MNLLGIQLITWNVKWIAYSIRISRMQFLKNLQSIDLHILNMVLLLYDL